MSEHSLPDNLGDWPDNPYEILGVSRHCEPRDLRRAYLRLIRAFKPEYHPDAFQKIREAFETVERDIERRDLSNQSNDEGDDSPTPFVSDRTDSDERAEASSFASTHSETPHEMRARHKWNRSASQNRQSHDEQLDEIWEVACAGRRDVAYARLVAMRHQHIRLVDVCQRLYWLLLADPRLDSERTPCDWLCEGLMSGHLSAELLELYCRELRRDPMEALRPRCEKLLDVDAEPRAISQLLKRRWEAMFLQDDCQLISQDLDRVRRRFVFEAEPIWVKVLLNAIGFLAFIKDDESAMRTFNSCLVVLEKLTHLNNEVDDAFDRMDELVLLRKDWLQLRLKNPLRQSWIDLVPFGWLNLYEASRSRLIVMLDEMTQQPKAALREVDDIVMVHPLLMEQIMTLITEHGHRHGRYWPSRDEKDVKQLVRRFLHQLWSMPFNLFRDDLLAFCLDETIFPQDVARIADELAQESNVECAWSADLYRDVGLRTICLAHSVFWD